jgi:uncharacterized protein
MRSMNTTANNEPIINTQEFARTGGYLEGQVNGEDLYRAADLFFEDQASIAWTLRGEQLRRADGSLEARLRLTVSGSAEMVCLRCLGVVTIPVGVERQYRLAKDEAHAGKLDEDDDLVDALVGSTSFEVLDLVEDEVILALPFTPKHEHCALPITKEGSSKSDEFEAENEKPNPFRVLAQLKKPNP